MLFMNTWEVDEARRMWQGHPVLSKATQLLADLRDIVDANSDGWHSWAAPCRAAKKLQELIQSARPACNNTFTGAEVTEAQLKKAITPIKSFYTRNKHQLKAGVLTFPI